MTTLLNKAPDRPARIPKITIRTKDFWSILAKAGIFSRLGLSPKTKPDVTVAEIIVRGI